MPANQKLIDNIDCLIRLEQSGAAYPRIPNTAVLFLDQARDRLSEAADILRQAQSCILGEMPEDCSAVEGKLDTLDRIRGFLND